MLAAIVASTGFTVRTVPAASSHRHAPLAASGVPRIDRRTVVEWGCEAGAASLLLPSAALAAAPAAAPVLSSSWSATDGFSDTSFISFDEGAYASMRDDASRTPAFEKAIKERLAGTDDKVVLDLGTGPFALLAIIAARAGARKVYAIEAQPEAARRARQVIKEAGLADRIEVIEGFSTAVQLPEKADLALAEIVGSIASEEGMYATIRDAQARHLKAPGSAASWIPLRCQTLAAPASYALHYALGPPQFDWGKLKEPVRLNCRDETLQLLADPVVLEDICFADLELPAAGSTWRPASPPSFVVDGGRIDSNEAKFYEELTREGAKDAEAKPLAAAVARSLSGVAMWPRLVLDQDATIVCESRGPRGEHQKSHWQTVLPLLSARPRPVTAGDTIVVDATVQVQRVDQPLVYKLDAKLRPALG